MMETTATLNPAPSPERRRRFNPFRAIGTALLFVLLFVRVLVRKLLTLVVLFVLLLGKNKTATAVGVVGLALLLWTWSVNGVPWAPAPPAEVAVAEAGPQIPPSPYVQQFLEAMANHDAQGVWDSFADEVKAQMQSQGGVAQLQTQLTQEARSGIQWAGATHVASTKLADGKMVYLYIVTQKTPRGTGQAPYTFTTLPNGKILRFD